MATSPTSGPGGGGGLAAGSYLPVADAAGVTVDTTTYADPIKGGGAKLTTLVFPADQGALAIARSGDLFPRWLLASDATDGLYIGNGAQDPYAHGGQIYAASGDSVGLDSLDGGDLMMSEVVQLARAASNGVHAPRLNQVSPAFTIVSGALPTIALVSGAGAQVNTGRDAETVTPVTFNPTAGAAATCAVALSPDNVTYSALGTETEPPGITFDGTIHLIRVRVPAGWYVRLTAVNATIGTTTYY